MYKDRSYNQATYINNTVNTVRRMTQGENEVCVPEVYGRTRDICECMSAGDKIFMDSIVRRQEMAMQDLFILADKYPGLIPSDILGGLYSLNILLQDRKSQVMRAL